MLVAVANGANDIANSVGTSVGAKALTLRQAIFFGLTAEVLGAMTLGSLVAKTISKGVIAPEVFDAQVHGHLSTSTLFRPIVDSCLLILPRCLLPPASCLLLPSASCLHLTP